MTLRFFLVQLVFSNSFRVLRHVAKTVLNTSHPWHISSGKGILKKTKVWPSKESENIRSPVTVFLYSPIQTQNKPTLSVVPAQIFGGECCQLWLMQDSDIYLKPGKINQFPWFKLKTIILTIQILPRFRIKPVTISSLEAGWCHRLLLPFWDLEFFA